MAGAVLVAGRVCGDGPGLTLTSTSPAR